MTEPKSQGAQRAVERAPEGDAKTEPLRAERALENSPSVTPWHNPIAKASRTVGRDVVVDCGWGRLIFGHTFTDNAALVECIRREQRDRRDIAMYIGDPHVVLSLAPQKLFLDPSHTYRLFLEDHPEPPSESVAFRIRPLQTLRDAERVDGIYNKRHMVAPGASVIAESIQSKVIQYLVAEDVTTHQIIGHVMGVDHVEAFGDPERGSSLWALAVDPQTTHPGVGQALVAHLVSHFKRLGRAFIDLSVMHDNSQAIRLYEKLGFARVPVFCIKNRNRINEHLFTGHEPSDGLNPYAQIIIREARRRGIVVELLDQEQAYFSLTHGGRTIVCRESLSELTTAIAMSRCDDKRVTRRLLSKVGLRMPAQQPVGDERENAAFLNEHKRIVVKPVRGEQGRGVSVGIVHRKEMADAIVRAASGGADVILEEMVQGHDLRIIVIDYRVAAAAIRKPPEVVGTGEHTVRELIEKQSRRRAAATGGESCIPLDEETERCVAEAGYDYDAKLAVGEVLVVRQAANLHAGGTIHDVTDELHPSLVTVAKRAAEVLDIPVVGLDLIVPSVRDSIYWIVEANERPGLANHEPQPTAERFIDLLFPQTVMTAS